MLGEAGINRDECAENCAKRKVKSLVFFHAATMGSLAPYIGLYVQSTGVTVAQLGILHALGSLTGLAASPAWGILLDMGCPAKPTMALAFLVSSFLRLALLLTESFPYILFLRLTEQVVGDPVFLLLDRVMLHCVSGDTSQYGTMRVYARLGNGFAILVASQVVGRLHPLSFGNGYGGAFLVYICLSIPCLLCTFLFMPSSLKHHHQPKQKGRHNEGIMRGSELVKDPDQQLQAPTIKKRLSSVLRPLEARLFCLQTSLLGFTAGILEALMFKRLETVGATTKDFSTIISATQIVSLCLGVVVLHHSGKLMKWVGGAFNTLLLSLAVRSLNLVVLSMIQNPYQSIPTKVLDTINFPVMISALTIQADRLAPQGLQSTLLGLKNLCFNGFGRTLGAVVGGVLASSWGISQTMMFQAVVNFTIILYFHVKFHAIIYPNNSAP